MAAPFLFVLERLVFGAGLLLFLLASRRKPVAISYFDRRVFGIVLLNLTYILLPLVLGTAYADSWFYLLALSVVFVVFWWSILRVLTPQEVGRLADIAVACAWIAWLYAIATLLAALGYIPFEVPDIYGNTNVDVRSIAVSSGTVSALLFPAPVLTYRYLSSGGPVKLLLLSVFWMGIVALGRRSALAGLVVPLVVFSFVELTGGKHTPRSVVILLSALLLFFMVVMLNVADIGNILFGRLQSTTAENETQRLDQFWSLIDGFLRSPLIGSGMGAGVSVIRSETFPWRYELSYIAALFRYGFLGCVLYAIAYGSPILWCWRNLTIMTPRERALIVGVISQCLAYFFNPVFDTFDAVWQVLLPMLLVAQVKSRVRHA